MVGARLVGSPNLMVCAGKTTRCLSGEMGGLTCALIGHDISCAYTPKCICVEITRKSPEVVKQFMPDNSVYFLHPLLSEQFA